MEFGGFAEFAQIRVSGLGLEDGKTLVTEERIEMAASELRGGRNVGTIADTAGKIACATSVGRRWGRDGLGGAAGIAVWGWVVAVK
jgi:hypothetical protein